MKSTTKQFIIEFVKQQHLERKDFVMGGVIEDVMRTRCGAKGETSSRLCRMLENEGILEAVYIPRKDGGRSNVAYKLRELQNEETKKAEDTFPIKEISVEKLFAVDTNEGLKERNVPMYNVRKDSPDGGDGRGTRNWRQTQLFTI